MGARRPARAAHRMGAGCPAGGAARFGGRRVRQLHRRPSGQQTGPRGVRRQLHPTCPDQGRIDPDNFFHINDNIPGRPGTRRRPGWQLTAAGPGRGSRRSRRVVVCPGAGPFEQGCCGRGQGLSGGRRGPRTRRTRGPRPGGRPGRGPAAGTCRSSRRSRRWWSCPRPAPQPRPRRHPAEGRE